MKKIIFVFTIFILLIPSVNSGNIIPMDKFGYVKTEVARCESRFVHNKWGDTNTAYPAYGIYQFQKRTFNYLKKIANRPELQWKSEKDQVWLFNWVCNYENGKYLKYWSCYQKLQKKHVAHKTVKVDKYSGVFSKHKEKPITHGMLIPAQVNVLTIKI